MRAVLVFAEGICKSTDSLLAAVETRGLDQLSLEGTSGFLSSPRSLLTGAYCFQYFHPEIVFHPEDGAVDRNGVYLERELVDFAGIDTLLAAIADFETPTNVFIVTVSSADRLDCIRLLDSFVQGVLNLIFRAEADSLSSQHGIARWHPPAVPLFLSVLGTYDSSSLQSCVLERAVCNFSPDEFSPPTQSYEIEETEEGLVRAAVVARFCPNHSRRDKCRRFTEKEVEERGGDLISSGKWYLRDVLYKVGLGKKYGA